MNWSRVSGDARGKWKWTGPLPPSIIARYYANGKFIEWTTLDIVAPAVREVAKLQFQAAPRSVNRVCPCCQRAAQNGEEDFDTLGDEGVCRSCWLYLEGHEDTVPVPRSLTLAEFCNLPALAVSPEARAVIEAAARHWHPEDPSK